MLRDFFRRLLAPSYDQVVDTANRELHMFQRLKYKNYPAAEVHRKRAIALFQQAARMQG